MEIRLKRMNEDDLERVRCWRNSPEVSGYMYNDDVITPEQQKAWYNNMSKDATKRYWVVVVDGTPVGVVNLYNIDNRNKRCYWAYYLADPSIRGKGIGKILECNMYKHVFETMKLNKLCCEVFKSNEIVVKMHEKYGSSIEGTFKEHVYKNEKFHDIVCMAITRTEWENIKENMVYEQVSIDPDELDNAVF